MVLIPEDDALREHEAGAKTADLERKHGISEATLRSSSTATAMLPLKSDFPPADKERYCFGIAAGDALPTCGGVPQTSIK
jgi:hypothetical protein